MYYVVVVEIGDSVTDGRTAKVIDIVGREVVKVLWSNGQVEYLHTSTLTNLT